LKLTGKLNTIEKRLFFILFYLKTNPTFAVLGLDFDLDKGNAHSHIKTLLPILSGTLKSMGFMPERVLNNPDELKELIKNEVVIIDATERPCVRPCDYDTQKDYYSGKKSTHTIKNSSKIVFLGDTNPGKIHDYKLLKDELPPNENWFKDLTVFVDLGYLGIRKDYSNEAINVPHKKPKKSKNNPDPQLTDQQKEENKKLSKERVKVEHVIGSMKQFYCLIHRCRNHLKEFKDYFIAIAAGIHNFKLHCKTTS
jgi:hypothetical protein